MRGKVVFRVVVLAFRGITPAYAGKSRPNRRAAGPVWDHPRMCGEKRSVSALLSAVMGSPPRMRGKVAAIKSAPLGRRITPACAGKRLHPLLLRLFREDHPRVCGEKRYRFPVQQHPRGSPPRVRGKGYDVVGRLGGVRITPACAGKRPKSRKNGPNTWDHPRVCGEKLVEAGRISQEEGSPPRVRGKVPSSI